MLTFTVSLIRIENTFVFNSWRLILLQTLAFWMTLFQVKQVPWVRYSVHSVLIIYLTTRCTCRLDFTSTKISSSTRMWTTYLFLILHCWKKDYDVSISILRELFLTQILLFIEGNEWIANIKILCSCAYILLGYSQTTIDLVKFSLDMRDNHLNI